MANYCVNIFLDEEIQKKLEDCGLGDQIKDIEGKKAVQVPLGRADLKKIQKKFPDVSFDDSNACVLPDDASKTIVDVILGTETVECMKVAITKLYNPLEGKPIRSKIH